MVSDESPLHTFRKVKLDMTGGNSNIFWNVPPENGGTQISNLTCAPNVTSSAYFFRWVGWFNHQAVLVWGGLSLPEGSVQKRRSPFFASMSFRSKDVKVSFLSSTYCRARGALNKLIFVCLGKLFHIEKTWWGGFCWKWEMVSILKADNEINK